MQLGEKLASRQARLGVIGLGYVGLPLSVEMAEAGFSVVGIDADPRKVAEIKAKRSYISDVPTPLSKTKDPDVSYILDAVKGIKAHLHRGQLIVLESTTYPGTTDELIRT